MTDTITPSTLTSVRDSLIQTLRLPDGGASAEGAWLVHNIAEIDFMAEDTILTVHEQRYDVFVDDTKIKTEPSGTLHRLAEFVDPKRSE